MAIGGRTETLFGSVINPALFLLMAGLITQLTAQMTATLHLCSLNTSTAHLNHVAIGPNRALAARGREDPRVEHQRLGPVPTWVPGAHLPSEAGCAGEEAFIPLSHSALSAVLGQQCRAAAMLCPQGGCTSMQVHQFWACLCWSIASSRRNPPHCPGCIRVMSALLQSRIAEVPCCAPAQLLFRSGTTQPGGAETHVPYRRKRLHLQDTNSLTAQGCAGQRP